MDPNEKALELLAEIAKWSREAALPSVQKRVQAMLDSEVKLRVYDAIKDGSMTARKLENAALGVRREAAQKLIDDWVAAGLVTPGSNPPKANFTLAELGIPRPLPKAARGSRSVK